MMPEQHASPPAQKRLGAQGLLARLVEIVGERLFQPLRCVAAMIEPVIARLEFVVRQPVRGRHEVERPAVRPDVFKRHPRRE